jgi:hypothetical protein
MFKREEGEKGIDNIKAGALAILSSYLGLKEPGFS